MSVVEDLDRLVEKMRSGRITENQLNELRLLSIQQMIIDQKLSCGDQVLNMEKANLVSLVDAIGTLVFYPQWTPQTPEVQEDGDTREIEELEET